MKFFWNVNYRGQFITEKLRSPIIYVSKNVLSYSHKLKQFSNSELLKMNLRLAVAPSPDTFPSTEETGAESSTLAGNPTCISSRRGIRAEVLAKWDQRPRMDKCREWIKNTVYH